MPVSGKAAVKGGKGKATADPKGKGGKAKLPIKVPKAGAPPDLERAEEVVATMKEGKVPPTVEAPSKSRPVIYPEFRVSKQYGADAITWEGAKELLAWEDEDQLLKRLVSEAKEKGYTYPDEVLAKGLVGSGILPDTFPKHLLIDKWGKKVWCWNSTRNRPYDSDRSNQYCQDELTRNWAGEITSPDKVELTYGGTEPYTLRDGTVLNPGDTFEVISGTPNGDTLCISRTAEVHQGNHRLIGTVFAGQKWEGAVDPKKDGDKDDSEHWKTLWPDGPPVLETLLVVGVSDLEKIVMTYDNTKPRSESDIIGTSDVFSDEPDRTKRKDLSKILAVALDMVMRRSKRKDQGFCPMKTHASSMAFLHAHPYLVDCVRFVHEANNSSGKPISGLYMSAGLVAGLMYLMAASATDASYYINPSEYPSADPEGEASEEGIDFANKEATTKFLQEMLRSSNSVLNKILHCCRRPVVGGVDRSASVFAKEVPNLDKLCYVAKLFQEVVLAGGNPAKMEELVQSEDFVEYDILRNDGPGEDNTVINFGLRECITVGGIDQGEPSFKRLEIAEEDLAEGGEGEAAEPTDDDAPEEEGEDEEPAAAPPPAKVTPKDFASWKAPSPKAKK